MVATQMRYLLLHADHDQSQADVHAKLSEEEFVVKGLAFLSAIANVDQEYLQHLCLKLFPHELRLDSPYQQLSAEQSDQHGQSTTVTDASLTAAVNDRELFMTYTTLEDSTSPNHITICEDTRDTVMSNYENRGTVKESPIEKHNILPTNKQLDVPSSPLFEMESECTLRNLESSAESSCRSLIESDMIGSANSHLSADGNTLLCSDNTMPAGIDTVCPPGIVTTELSPTSPGQSSNGSFLRDGTPETPAYAGSSHYLRAFNALSSIYDNTSGALTDGKIIEVIRVGDSFLRKDAARFISSDLNGLLNKLWCHDEVPNPTSTCSLTEKLFKSFRCAEILGQRSAIDPLRIRFARILLYQYLEQLCKESRPQGRSVAIDRILEETYPQHRLTDSQVQKKRRDSLMKHKKIGKRWSMLVQQVGSGLLLMCSSELAAQVGNTSFSTRMIEALLTYVIHAYPRGVHICKMLSSLSDCIMGGHPVTAYMPDPDTIGRIIAYSQNEEKETNEFPEQLQRIQPLAGFVQITFQ